VAGLRTSLPQPADATVAASLRRQSAAESFSGADSQAGRWPMKASRPACQTEEPAPNRAARGLPGYAVSPLTLANPWRLLGTSWPRAGTVRELESGQQNAPAGPHWRADQLQEPNGRRI